MNIKEELPEDFILVRGESKVFTQPSKIEDNKNSFKKIRGLLSRYKKEFTSVELQERASVLRSNVSDSRNS